MEFSLDGCKSKFVVIYLKFSELERILYCNVGVQWLQIYEYNKFINYFYMFYMLF